MKKLYTILAVAALALCANAAPVERMTRSNATHNAEAFASVAQKAVAQEVKKSETVRRAPRKAAAKATLQDLDGKKFLLTGYGKWASETGNPYLEDLAATTFTVEEDGTVSIYPFIFDMTAKATFDAETQKLTLSPEPMTASFEDGQTIDLRLYEYLIDSKTMKGIEFTVDLENRKIYAQPAVDDEDYYTSAYILANAALQIGSYNAVYYLFDFNEFNSIMLNDAYDYSTGEEYEETSYMYAALTDGKLIFNNFYGFGFSRATEFELDNADKTATATNQTFGYSQDYGAEWQLWSFNDEGNLENRIVTMEWTTEQGISFFYCPAMFFGFSTGDYHGQGYIPTEIMIVLNFDPFETSVSEISVADENAPVEYFNLQGVRVANPENGLYIRRQGKTVTKVLVK